MTMDRSAETARISGLLRNRHSGEDWAYFDELRSRTGWGSEIGYMDGFAAGLWSKNKGFFAYEIKTDRSDFKGDIAKFQQKQAVALRNSNQFYYVCPHKMISISETPEVAGLMYADAGGIKVVKVAPIRELEGKCLDANFTRALLRAAATKLTFNPFLKYCGKDISEEDLKKLAEECGKKMSEWSVKTAAEEMAKKNRSEAEKILESVCVAVGMRFNPPCYDLKHFAEDLHGAIKRYNGTIWLAEHIKDNVRDMAKAAESVLEDVGKLDAMLKKGEEKKGVDGSPRV